MTFMHLQQEAIAFTEMVNGDLGRVVIHPMTLETPAPPPDELYFTRVVVWCYGFFYEAAADVLKECKAMLKTREPEQTNQYESSARVVQNLRTYKVHNLPPSKGNLKKQEMARQWIADATAKGEGIASAAEELCQITRSMLSAVASAWKESTQDPGDRAQLIERVVHSLEETWEPHQLDEIVSNVAEEIGLKGFDAKAFRSIHLDTWRGNARCFIDRDAATEGLRRSIRKAMVNAFGGPE